MSEPKTGQIMLRNYGGAYELTYWSVERGWHGPKVFCDINCLLKEIKKELGA